MCSQAFKPVALQSIKYSIDIFEHYISISISIETGNDEGYIENSWKISDDGPVKKRIQPTSTN